MTLRPSQDHITAQLSALRAFQDTLVCTHCSDKLEEFCGSLEHERATARALEFSDDILRRYYNV